MHVHTPLHNTWTVCVEWGSTNTVCLIMCVGPYNGVSSISSDGSVLLVSCPAHVRLPARNGLVNKVKFLGLITQNG